MLKSFIMLYVDCYIVLLHGNSELKMYTHCCVNYVLVVLITRPDLTSSFLVSEKKNCHVFGVYVYEPNISSDIAH
jgi:hypothetical protein